MTGKKAVLVAFDRLFDRAAAKLQLECDEEEKADARRHFTERFATALDAAQMIDLPEIPEEVIEAMEQAIDSLSKAQVAGHLAAIPLAHQAQKMAQMIANRAAEQRLIEHLISQADNTYGGN